jgi:FixJ family two-component response regulator
MKAGAVDFLCKPFGEQELLDAVLSTINIDITQRERAIPVQKIRECYEQLTPREREVMLDVTNGMMNKQIAHRLGLSEITIKVHRGSIVKKMEARSVAELVRQADMVKADYRTL